jgi:hypothetical protein
LFLPCVFSFSYLRRQIRFGLTIPCLSQVLVAHICIPSYSDGRDQEDCGLKPALGKQIVLESLS